MSDIVPGVPSSRRFPPLPRSAREAREFVRHRLGDVAQELRENAELLVSELVANVVLHARTDAEVSVRRLGDRVEIRVRDERPQLGLLPQQKFHRFPATGHGLFVVERLATRFGVETGEDAKTVWVEIGPEGTPREPSDWGSAVLFTGARRPVTLIDLPDSLFMAAHQNRRVLLRELRLAALGGDDLGVRPKDLAVADDVNHMVGAWVDAALSEHPVAEAGTRSLTLSVPADAGLSVLVLRRVLDRAEDAARSGRMLSRPALPSVRELRSWLFGQIAGQIAGGHPTAWTVIPRDPRPGPLEMVPWDAAQVRASRTPTVAADEEKRIVAVNAAAAALLGWDPDELVGRRLLTIVPEHLRQRYLEAFTSLLTTGRSHILGRSVPLPALHRDGRQIPIRLVIETQHTADGATMFVAHLIPRAGEAPAAAPGRGAGQGDLRAAPGVRPALAPVEEQALARGTPVVGEALERLGLIVDTGRAITDASDLYQGLREVCRILTVRLADWCVVDLFAADTEGERVGVVRRDRHGRPADGVEGTLPPLTESGRGPLARVLRGARPLLLGPIGADEPPGQVGSPLDARHRALFDHLGADSAVVAPLRARREVLGAVTLARTGSDRPFTEADLTFVDDLAHGIAVGVDNARMYAETRGIAEQLQRSLLPVLPELPHLRITARYVPSSVTAEVGGDWYDCFVLPGGDLAVTIGDVAGHDLSAAVAMSQLRSMLRGIAVDREEPPGEVVRRLDIANHTLHREATATCVYGLVGGPVEGPWVFHHSAAGHLPPLLTTEDGETRFLEEGTGLMLGTGIDMPRPATQVRLPPRSTVLLYTDGLVERRGESLTDSLARLRRQTADLARMPLDVFCDELLVRLGTDGADDIAMLALRPVPPPY
ncbi:SpoIIE family protein phosphatase [Streptomyces abyssomicinicus]|uniref:SpoIIE family protein phosphatase n=1 Tax=Streptomyces abyssomicinicus TaxID=574929 RepID=UPI001FE86D50|nr:SpoIIE family protein phosphatase [Streptomyces abyssomicinicus]